MSISYKNEIIVPLTVSKSAKKIYIENYKKATSNSGKLFLFAGDQKIEHLNEDFYGAGISKEDNNPKHLFEIASQSRIGAFATQLGLVARYGNKYKNINYIIKLNSKTNIIPIAQTDPKSLLLNTVEEVKIFKKNSGLSIAGVGYTIYLGSEFESIMLSQAANIIFEAHNAGLITILWIYPRGKAVKNERDISMIAGACGVGACLGSDFVKINTPEATTNQTSASLLTTATTAAGNTKVICSGGKQKKEPDFLKQVYEEIHIGGCGGAAVGRNIHQKSLVQAKKLCAALASIIFDNQSYETAIKFLK